MPDIKHTYQTAVANDPAKEVSSTRWNASHTTPAVVKGDLLVSDGSALQKQAVGTDGQTLLADSTQPNGIKWGTAGASWVQDINESGASFANFTGATGTWASNGTVIQQTDGAAVARRAKYNTKIPIGFPFIYEAEMRMVTASGANQQMGLLLGFDGVNGGGISMKLDRGTGNMTFERESITLLQTFAFTIVLNTWYKMRIVWGNASLSVYIDGVLLFNSHYGASGFSVDASLVGITSYQAAVDFRNIKAWTLRGGVPA